MCKILAWPGYQSQLPSIAKMPKFPLPFRGLKAETPDLLGINALADRGWEDHYHYLKHTL